VIRVHIDELVLDGCDLPADQRAAVHEAVRRELATLFRTWHGGPPPARALPRPSSSSPAAPGLARSRALPRLVAGPVRLGPAARLGGDIAHAVHTGVTGLAAHPISDSLSSGGGSDG
jgi:hypothetical protein